MFSTRVPLPGAAPRRRRLWPVAGGLLVVAAFAGAARAQPPAAPPPPPGGQVAALQNILRQEAGPDLAARQAAIKKLIDSMDLEQLSRVLVLPDWRVLESAVPRSEAERNRIQSDLQARNAASNLFLDKAKEAVKAAKTAPAGAAPEEQETAALDKAATADLIGETAVAVRTLDYRSQIPGPLAPTTRISQIGDLPQKLSELTADLIDLTGKDQDPRVRRSVTRALGQIQLAIPLTPPGASAPPVVVALKEIFADPNNPPGLRIAAAQSLDDLCRNAAEETQRSLGQREDVKYAFLDLAQAVGRAVLQKGASSDLPEVRRTCLQAFGRIAAEMLDISVIPETNEAPPRILDPKMIEEMKTSQARYFHRVSDLFADLQANSAPLADAVRDPDPQARQTALTILVDLANVRDRLRRLAAGEVPLPSPEPGRTGPTPTEGKKIPPEAARDLGAALILTAADEPTREQSQQKAFEDLARAMDATVNGLAANLRAPDPGTRRVAVDVLEILGPAAFPAVDALVEALRDPDRFVRWAAARTLGELAPAQTDKQKFTPAQVGGAVAGLQSLLRDEDVGVRLAAVTALEHFGPPAAPAGPLLTRMLNRSQTDASLAIVPTAETDPDLVKGDPTVRIGAFRALEAINDDEAVRALPEAEFALLDQNALVRQAAADFIGQEGPKTTGPQRQELKEALGAALSDKSGDVRRSASAALLRLLAPKPK